jgi:hypothetical protein
VNLEKVVFGFFVLLAATLNFGFFLGDISDPEVHNSYELFLALIVALITTILKFGDSTQLGAVHQSGRVAPAGRGGADVGVGHPGFRRWAGRARHGERGFPLGRGAVGQPGVGHPSCGRDRDLPPPLALTRR